MNLKLFNGDLKLADEFESFPLIFSRASIANNPDGSVLQVNQAGFQGDGVGVNGLGVFEGTTNILTSAQSQSLTGAITTATLNGSHTISMKGSGSIAVSGGLTGTVTKDTPLSGTITSSTVTLTPNGDCRLVQLEAKAYSTPWILGGTTRQPESCYIPVEEVKKFLKLNEGCIELLFSHNPNSKVNSNICMFYYMGPVSEFPNQFYGDTVGKRIRFVIYDKDGGFSLNQTSNSILKNGYNTHTINWRDKRQELVANNQIFKIKEGTGIGESIRYYDFNIGNMIRNVAISNHINEFIKSIVFSKPRTEEERLNRQRFAEANGYYPIDDKVTAFLDLESGLRAYRRTTQ